MIFATNIVVGGGDIAKTADLLQQLVMLFIAAVANNYITVAQAVVAVVAVASKQLHYLLQLVCV